MTALPPPSEVVTSLREKLPSSLHRPALAIVCGSGLAGLADLLEERVDVPYTDIRGFAESTVVGHKSMLSFGMLSGVAVVCQAGRFHYYEGKPLSMVVYPVKVFHALGCKAIIVTNAAGGLNPAFSVPTICLIQDHIAIPALAGLNPLIGPNDESIGPRFPPMSNAYDIELQRAAYQASHELGFKEDLIQSGTYAWVIGPTYETRADCKFLREYCGADMVGMSTVPEVIVARHAGMRVLGLSLITNKVINTPYRDIKSEVAAEYASRGGASQTNGTAGTGAAKIEVEETTSHEEVLEVGRLAAKDMSSLVAKIVEIAGSTL